MDGVNKECYLDIWNQYSFFCLTFNMVSFNCDVSKTIQTLSMVVEVQEILIWIIFVVVICHVFLDKRFPPDDKSVRLVFWARFNLLYSTTAWSHQMVNE